MFARYLVSICLATLLFTVSVSAGLYATAPIASTVWSAGSSQTVTWTDDKSTPHLGQLGLINIELLSDDDVSYLRVFLFLLALTYVQTPVAMLAQNVDPTSKSQNVSISSAWGHNGSN